MVSSFATDEDSHVHGSIGRLTEFNEFKSKDKSDASSGFLGLKQTKIYAIARKLHILRFIRIKIGASLAGDDVPGT